MTPPPAPPTDAEKRKLRRVLIGIISGIALIGVVGVLIALNVSPEDADPIAVAPETAPTVDPLSTQGLCQSERVVDYDVAVRPKRAGELTTTAAAEPWLLDGESSLSTSTGSSTKLVALGRPGAPPREVLSVRRSARGWVVTRTTACLDALPDGKACPPATLTRRSTTYTREDDQRIVAGPYVGPVSLTSCLSDDATAYAARGEIAPVSAYEADGQQPGVALVVTEGDAPASLFLANP